MCAMMRLPCLATAHCTFGSYVDLEAERVNQFWWNLVHNCKLWPQWQSRYQILIFKIPKIPKCERPSCWKIFEISYLAYQWTDWDPTWVVTSHHVPDVMGFPMIWLPWQRPLPSNGALNILQLRASGGRTREPILTKFGTQQHVMTTMTVTY